MALELSAKAKILSQKPDVRTSLIVEIDGYDLVFGAEQVKRGAKIGDAGLKIGQDGLKIGGVILNPNQRDYIMLDGTTKTLSQQLFQGKGGSGSVGAIKVQLVDKGQELTKLFSPSGDNDVLGNTATVYLNFVGSAHPKDSIRILTGIVDDIAFGAGYVELNISHPEQLKRAEIFQNIKTELAAAIDSEATTITLDSTDGLLFPGEMLRSYVTIGDEVIEYSSVFGGQLLGCVRGTSYGGAAEAHDAGDEVSSCYRLIGKMKDLSLALMLSGHRTAFASEIGIININQVSEISNIQNAILFPFDVQEKYGLVEGDYVSIAGANNDENIVAGRKIVSFGENTYGGYIVLEGLDMVTEIESPATASFVSKYALLPDGCEMTPTQVDVAEHEKLEEMFGARFLEYDFFFDDTIEAQELINEQIYFPSGCYQLPRKGRVSLGITTPPIADRGSVRLDSSNILNPEKLKIERSTKENFYNTVVYRYEHNYQFDKFVANNIHVDEDSQNRIKVGNSPLKIEAKGLRKGEGVTNLLDSQSERFLERFRFGAERVKSIQVNSRTGCAIEIGDSAVFGDSDLKMSDIKNASRSFSPRIMEVVNKKHDLQTGVATIDLLDTAFSLNGRYGVIGPSSIVTSGSSTTVVKLLRSYSTGENEYESEKWSDYIGMKVLIHSDDWTYQEETILKGFDAAHPNHAIVAALSEAPPEGAIMDIPGYDDSSYRAMEFYKKMHCFLCASVRVASGISTTQLTIDSGDLAKVFENALVQVHSEDYSETSKDVRIQAIDGNTITINEIEFTPQENYRLKVLSFKDGGLPYRFI